MSAITNTNGKTIYPGCFIRVNTIPDWLTHDLPSEDVIRLKATQRSVMRVIEIDKLGYVWLAAEASSSGWFCLKLSEMEVLSEHQTPLA